MGPAKRRPFCGRCGGTSKPCCGAVLCAKASADQCRPHPLSHLPRSPERPILTAKRTPNANCAARTSANQITGATAPSPKVAPPDARFSLPSHHHRRGRGPVRPMPRLWTMSRGTSPNLSQKLMRWRVGLQFAAIVIIMLFTYIAKQQGWLRRRQQGTRRGQTQ